MPTPGISTTVSSRDDFSSDAEYIRYLAGIIARAIQEFNYILSGNLDVANIKAKSITADRMSVKELSAISANLGHITAGLIEAVTIVGSMIKTSYSTPRVELSNTENVLAAYVSDNDWIKIIPDTLGGAQIVFNNEGMQMTMSIINSLLNFVFLFQMDGSIQFNATGDIISNPGPGGKHRFGSWSEVWSNGAGHSLQYELDSISSSLYGLSSRISALESAPPPSV